MLDQSFLIFLENYYQIRKTYEQKIKVRDWRNKNPQEVKIYRYKKQKELKEFLHEIKINGCAICGYNKQDTKLHFHHANPQDKKFTVGSSPNRKQEEILKEINKCILLCQKCHIGLENKIRNKEE
jgi:hypothetical protein